MSSNDNHRQKIETYIRDHSEAEFSHSICPDCAKKLFDKYNNSIQADKNRATGGKNNETFTGDHTSSAP